MFEVGTKAAGIYEITGILGKGGTGIVYAVLDKNGKKRLAMKVCGGNRCLEERKREAEIQKKLRHRKIPRILDTFCENGTFCMVMEYRKGRTLEQLVREQGPLTEQEAVFLGMELCRLFAFLHERHRPVFYQDLKPSNLLIVHGHLEALIDFGCSREAESDGQVRACGHGTQGYAAPEQFQAGSVLSPGADIYGLGCTLRYALGEQRVSGKLDAVLRRCRMLREEERFVSMQELYRALSRCLREKYLRKSVFLIGILFFMMTAVPAGAVVVREVCYQQCVRTVQELLAEPLSEENRREVRHYFQQKVLPGQTCQEVLQQEKRDYALLLLQMGRREWYEGGGTAGKREGCFYGKEALETGMLTEQEEAEAGCYRDLLLYYEGEQKRLPGSVGDWKDAEAAMEPLWRLHGVLWEEQRSLRELLEIEAELLRAAYELPVEELRKSGIKTILFEMKSYLKKENESFWRKEEISEEQQERRAMLLEAAEELLQL